MGTTVEWMKPRIKSMICNIRKQKTTNQNNKKKKESKRTPQNKNTIAASGTTSEGPTFALQGCQKKRKSKVLELY